MYAGFKIAFDGYEKELYDYGMLQYKTIEAKAVQSLKKYITKDGALNGSQMQEDWFPELEADVFLSHSHKDFTLAVTFAGILRVFGLSVFIDSCVWSFADTLLRSIDNEYCISDDRKFYHYNKRNRSTSHVHMMLSTALSMMMDKCEAVFFLNTENSLTVRGSVEKTDSPWLYSEIGMTRILRKRPLTDYRPIITKSVKESVEMFSRKLKVDYTVNTEHLIELTQMDLRKWTELHLNTQNDESNALDLLYSLIAKRQKKP